MTPNPDEITAAARAWLGTPYRHQGSTLGAGCDCLGLLRGIWRTLYGAEPIAIPPYRADWRDAAHTDTLLAAANRFLMPASPPLGAGQIVLLSMRRGQPPRHCAVMIGPDRFIHAQEHLGVVAANLGAAWARRVTHVFTFPETGTL